jgi:hypothetical protein
MVSVGAITDTFPSEAVLPSPASTWPSAARGRLAPYMKRPRRPMAGPAITYSLTAASRKPSGATMRTRPACTSSTVVTPSTPPKWSTWECV